MLRSKNRGAPSNMKLFPEDVVRAESLTHGNPAILQSEEFLPEEKPAYTELFASKKKTPKKVKSEAKKKPAPDHQNTPPRLITHPRFLQLSSGQSTDYEVRERQQTPIRAECDQEDATPPTSYSCVDCGYTTTRLNVIVWHNKSHTRNYASPTALAKGTKRKSAASTVKLKERSSSPSIQPSVDAEAVSAAKILKTNGQLKVARSPKTPGRKKGTSTAKKTPGQVPHTKETNSASSTPRIPPQKGRRGSAHKGDEIHKSLLEDWLEDDVEMEEPAADELSSVGSVVGENTTLANGSATSEDSKGKSCFDFDDSEDHLVIDESNFKPGRKIPRLLNKSALSTLAADDVVGMHDSMGGMEVEATSADSTAKYQSGVEDTMDGELSLSCSTTSQLQEMGVDNEIEIKTEDTHVTESVPPKKSRRNLKTDTKANNDADLLHDQVDKLLNEITKAPAKLPDIPRSHKKVQLKAYQQQAEAEEKAAQKAAAEAEAARNVADETEAAQNSASEVKTMQQVVTETEATQKTETEGVQRVAAKAEAAQKAAAKTEAMQEAAAKAEAAQGAAIKAEAAKVNSTQKTAAKAEAALITTEQKAAIEIETTTKILAAQYNVEGQEAYNLHPETMNIDVSSIPLPSPQKCPVTKEPVESSISIGASVTVGNETSDEPVSITSSVKLNSEALDVMNIAPEASGEKSGAVDQKSVGVTSSSHSPQTPNSVANVAEVSDIPATDDTKTSVKCSTASKTTKPLNTTPVQHSGQQKLKFISQSEYKLLMNKLNASINQSSPSKTSDEPLRAIKTTIKMTSGNSIVCNLGQPKVLLANSQTAGSPSKILILTNYKQASTPPATTTTATATAATTTPTTVGRSINLANATTLRVTPNILQKSAAAQRAAAALAKSSGKNIVLDASTFQSLFQTQPQQLRKLQSQLVLSEAAATAKPQAPSSANIVAAPSQPGTVFVAECSKPVTNSKSDCANTDISSSSSAGQTIDYNYIVDSSGNLVQVDEPPTARTPTKDKDILAKALEDTDGLHTEMALSETAANSVLDVGSVTQNADATHKTEAIYENVTLNTAPIMAAYETPSRSVATANILPEGANETEMVHSGAAKSNSEYLT